jgi:hypothetical protein
MVIFDQATGTRATKPAGTGGAAHALSGICDGPVLWGGLRWFSLPSYMLPEKDTDVRRQIMLHFRRDRRRRFPGAADNERCDEIPGCPHE